MKVELQLQLNSEAAGKKKSTVYYYESMQKGKTLLSFKIQNVAFMF